MKKEIRVLVLEDFAPDAELMIHELRRAGYVPEWQRMQTEEEFIDALDSDWDLILADFTLPQFDAVSALSILKDAGLEIPLIIVTGTISEEAALRCIQMGASDYLLKDRLTRLAAAVQHVLEEQFLREAKEKTEEALVQSEERFFRLAENATDIFCNIRVSPDIHVDYINPAIVRVLGYSPQEIRQKPHKIVEKVREEQKRTLINLLEDRLPFNKTYVFQWQAKDGSWKWIECSIVAIRDKNGQLAALEVVGRDVNDRVEAELALQDAHRLLEQRVEERTKDLREAKEAVQLSEERFRVALANAPLVVSTLDKNLRYTWVYKGSGMKDVATVGKTDEELLPPENGADLVQLKREVLAKGQPIRREVRLRLDGEDRFYDASVEPLRDAAGEIIGLTSARMDITDRKRWERILFEATQRLEQHMNNSPLAILELDPSAKIIRWNDGAERMFGFSASEVMGKNISDFKFLHEEDEESIYQAIGIATASKTFRTFHENRNYRKDGSVVYCHWYNSILFDEHGTPQSVLSQGLDVTEKTLAEREVIKAKERMSTILESITDAFMALDRDFKFTYVNQTAANLTRQTIENMIGRNIWDVFPEAIGSTFQQMYEKSIKENVTVEFEEFYAPFNAWYSVTCYPSTEGLSIFFDDVTARHEVLDKLRESEMQFRQIAENISEVLWMVDVKTEEYIYVSPNLAQVLGHQLTNFQDFLNIVHPEDRKLMRASRKKVLGGDYDEEFRIIRDKGDVAWLRARTFPIRDAQGEIYRIVGIAEDITARREFEEQRERLAAIVNFSHDGMVRLTLDGIVTDWNHGAEMLYGWSAEEAIGRSIFDLIIPPEEHEATRGFIARIVAGESFEAEAERICRDGRRIDISMTVSPIRDSAGNVVAISKVERDITQRKMAEESLRLSEERFHVALSDSPITVFNQDMDLKFTWIHNPPDHLAAEMMLGRTVHDFFEEEDAQRVTELSKEVMDSGTPHRAEARMFSDEKTLHYDIYIEPLRDANERIVGLTGAAIDITASKEAAAELARSTQEIKRERRQLRSVLQVLPVAVFIADASGKIVETNEAARALWGGQPPLIDMENFNLYKAWFKDTGHPVGSHDWAMAQALLTRREPPVQEVEIECFDGTHKTILNMAQPILNPNGELIGAVAVCHDITERTQITEQLRQLNERLEERVKQRTLYIELLRSVTQIANESLDVRDALRKTLEVVCRGMNWQIGHAFVVEDDANPTLVDTGIWHLPEEDASRYDLLLERTASASCGFHEGLIGKVQTSGEPQWILDIRNSGDFLRAQKGDDLGVTTAMAFPVLIEKSVVAVLEFFCEPKCELEPAQLELMSNIGTQFGRAVERERLQRQLTQVVLNEQRRMGHELHDSVGQALAGLAMKTKSLHGRLMREGSAEAEAIGNLMDQLSESVVHVRAIARGLFPVEIDANGLKAALVDLARQTRERYGIDCDCQFKNDAVVLDNNAATHLFRIAQEAVSNAVRHGNPQRILIHLEAEGPHFRLEVEDDGSGMDHSQTTRSGIGLSIMGYRARMIDAVLEIESAESGGVRVICTR